MSETSEITTPAIKAINDLPNCVAYRVQCGKVQVRGGWLTGAPEGMPDIGAVIDGTAVYFETKVRGGKASKAQYEMHARLRRAGASVEIVHSVAEVLTIARQHLR
jgi:hypothetical protein